MGSNFDFAVDRVLKMEGGFSNDPNDHGGATNWGITIGDYSRYLGRPATVSEVKSMPLDTAKKIYKKDYWDAMKLDLISDKRLAAILFDQGVNRGTVTAMKDMQNTLNSHFSMNLATDGKLGPITAKAINELDFLKVVVYYICDCQDRYNRILRNDPSQVVFAVGWGNRTQALLELLWA